MDSPATQVRAYLTAHPGPVHPADVCAATGLPRSTVRRHIPPDRRAPHRYHSPKIVIDPADLDRPTRWIMRRYRCSERTVRRARASTPPAEPKAPRSPTP